MYLMYIPGNEVDALCPGFPELRKAFAGGGLTVISGICYEFLV